MNNTQKHTQNKGFTLVELIIVVAVIAVLASVLAPQYLRYVERARESNDIQIASALLDAATIAIADPNNNVPSGYIIEVAWATDPHHSVQGTLVVRSPICSSSIWGLGVTGGQTAIPTAQYQSVLANLDENISTILQADITTENTSSAVDYYKPLIEKAQSVIANEEDFIYHINTATGAVVVCNESVRWVTEMGLNAVI